MAPITFVWLELKVNSIDVSLQVILGGGLISTYFALIRLATLGITVAGLPIRAAFLLRRHLAFICVMFFCDAVFLLIMRDKLSAVASCIVALVTLERPQFEVTTIYMAFKVSLVSCFVAAEFTFELRRSHFVAIAVIQTCFVVGIKIKIKANVC